MKFKIHTKEVRRAAKKKNLLIKQELTVETDCFEDEYYSCPIGALYCDQKNIDLNNESQVYEADNQALDWAAKRYGKHYVNGFVEGFDNPGNLDYSLEGQLGLNSKQKKSYINGYRNGELLARYLLEDQE